MGESDAAVFSGIALKSLDDIVRINPVWAGCWRDRLAHKSAAVAAKVSGRGGEEDAIWDAVSLTAAGKILDLPESCFWPHEC
nr:DUF1403 family protein [Shinella sp.]